jgi:hypothetical protein
MSEVTPRARRTEHVVLQLISAFDNARRAFDLEAWPGWARASVDLRTALTEAALIGDVGTLPCPLSWWVTCQASVRTWLEAPSADVRRGLSDAVNANIRALSKYASGEIELAPAPHGRGVE